jgi:hypothetical protein
VRDEDQPLPKRYHVSHIPKDVSEFFDDGSSHGRLLVGFEPQEVAGIEHAAAVARMSVTAFIHRAVAAAVAASPSPAAADTGTISPAAASPASKSVD